MICACLLSAVLTGCSPSAKGGDSISDKEAVSDSAGEHPDDGTIVIPTDSAAAVAEEVTKDNIDDFVELGEYKNLTIEAGENDPIKEGMTVNLSYSGTAAGKPFDGGTVADYELIVGSDSIVEGFEEQLIGHKAGDRVNVTVTFPKDYGNDSLAGKEVVYDVNIKAVYKTSPDIAYAQFLDSCTLRKYPSSLYDHWSKIYLDSYKDMLGSTDEEPGKEEILSAIGMDESMFNDLVQSNIKELLVIESVFGKEGISRDSDEYQAAMKAYLDRYEYRSKEDAVASGMPEDYLTYQVDLKVLQSILIKYEAK